MRGLSFSKTTVFASIGFGVAATISMGLAEFFSFFGLSRYLVYFSAAAISLAILGISGSRIHRNRMPSLFPLVLWAGLLSTINALLFLADPNPYAYQALKLLPLTFLALASAAGLSVLSRQRAGLLQTSTTSFFWGFIISASIVVLDPIINIRSALPAFDLEVYEKTRAAGFYLQPNLAGLVLPLFFAILVIRMSRFWVTILSVLLILATTLTFSRGSIGLTAAILLAAVFARKIPLWPLLLFAIVFLLLGLSVDIVYLIQNNFGIDSGSGLARLSNLLDMLSIQALGADSRSTLAQEAFSKFLESPLIGYGLGFSWEWEEVTGQGTHNIYLRFMLDYGFLGILIWPSLMWVLYKYRQPEMSRYWALTILSLSLFIGFFSHNLTEQSCILVTIAAAYVLPVPEQLNGRQLRI
jgi:O-antigen ligase